MAQKVYAVVSQKGGVGKTSISVSIAVAHATEGKSVLIADMDFIQASSSEWYGFREDKIENLDVVKCRTVKDVVKVLSSKHYDVVITDGAPHASALTLELAEVADVVILPTGTSMLDLKPSAKLAFEMIEKGVEREKILFALMKVTSKAEAISAKNALNEQNLVAKAALKVSTGFTQALDQGKSLQEASHPSLKEHAGKFIEALKNG